MRLMIPVDIDLGESSLSEHEVKDNVTEFARDLLIIGADEQGIALTLEEVEYEY